MRSKTRVTVEQTKQHVKDLRAIVVSEESYQDLLDNYRSEGSDIHFERDTDASTESFLVEGIRITKPIRLAKAAHALPPSEGEQASEDLKALGERVDAELKKPKKK